MTKGETISAELGGQRIAWDFDHADIKPSVRIWHLTKTVSGGAGQYALRLSNALRASGIESTVLVAEGPDGEGVEHLRRLDSSVRRYAARGFRGLSHRISQGPFHSLRGPEIYAGRRPVQSEDIVHLHGMTGWIGLASLQRLIPPGAKVFWTAHDLWMVSGGCVVYRGCEEFQRNCSGCPILRTPWKWLARQELRVKNAFMDVYSIQPIANSRWMADRIRESSVFGALKSIPVIPPIVDDAYLAEDIPDLRDELRIPQQRLVVSLGARSIDDKFKGIPQFLESLSHNHELSGSLTVLVFGPGQITVPNNLDVRLLGNLTDPRQLAKVYRTSNVFVSPSQMETFGMTLVEAQACGTPVVAFDVGGIRDAVPSDSYCWLEPTSRLDLLLQRLSRKLLSPDVGGTTAAQLREWAGCSFGAEHLVHTQLRLYQPMRQAVSE